MTSPIRWKRDNRMGGGVPVLDYLETSNTKDNSLDSLDSSSPFPLGFELVHTKEDVDQGRHINKALEVEGTMKGEDDLAESVEQAKDSVLNEVKKAWELDKSLGFSSTNEIDMIWAMAKDRKSKKEKKFQAAKRKNQGRKKGKEKL